MGVFDKVEKDAEEAMAQDAPRPAQQAGQLGGGQLSGGQLSGGQLSGGQVGQDMQAARNLIGKQRGAADQDGDQDGGDQDYSDEDW